MAAEVVGEAEVAALVRAAAGGDRAAFARLYTLSSPKLYGIILRILRRPEPAAEALRTTYLRIFAKADDLDPGDDPVAWMAAHAHACAIDLARAGEEPEAWEPFDAGDTTDDPLGRPERSPELNRLLACLGKLSEERRRILLLAYYEGWSCEALSVYFDIPAAGMKAWIARSVSQMAECLEP